MKDKVLIESAKDRGITLAEFRAFLRKIPAAGDTHFECLIEYGGRRSFIHKITYDAAHDTLSIWTYP